jgi:hypothetical protein
MLGALSASAGCASMPKVEHKKYVYPDHYAFVGDVKRPYTVLGPVRSRVEFPTLDPDHEEKSLCRNYYNEAVRKLVQYARKAGGDVVIDVRSVVFLEDGRSETYPTAECSDDGEGGQVLATGIAIKWKPGTEHMRINPQPPLPGATVRREQALGANPAPAGQPPQAPDQAESAEESARALVSPSRPAVAPVPVPSATPWVSPDMHPATGYGEAFDSSVLDSEIKPEPKPTPTVTVTATPTPAASGMP